MNYATELKMARIQAGIKQSDLAEKAECTQSMISKVENGLLAPSIDLLERIAKELGMSVVIDLVYNQEDIDKKESELSMLKQSQTVLKEILIEVKLEL